jgi:hypothetical protein
VNIGTKSILFGVHQFVWHPLTVAAAFVKVHRRLPTWWESVGIVCHDLGYWGCTDMDGPSGENHPRAGAALAAKICGVFSKTRAFDVYFFCLYHSSTFAGLHCAKVSNLYLPDKVCILLDPKWFYLLRARLSGELDEYVSRESLKRKRTFTDEEWLEMYRACINNKLTHHQSHV